MRRDKFTALDLFSFNPFNMYDKLCDKYKYDGLNYVIPLTSYELNYVNFC